MDNLPTEIIQNILKHLSFKDLLNCAVVCKRFNDIIGSYKMIKTLNCGYYWLDPDVISRKYRKLHICKTGSHLQTVLESTGKNKTKI